MPPSIRMNDEAQLCPSVLDLTDIDHLVRAYRSQVLRFAFAWVRDMDLAETVTQECFMRAFDKRHLFRGQCSVSTWLIAIATNLIRDYTRTTHFQFWKKEYASAVEPMTLETRIPGRQQSPESILISRDELRSVWGVVAGFPQKQQAIFSLRFVDEMGIKEIAAKVGISTNSVKSHLRRSAGVIRRKLGRTRR